jgi:phenylalanyl-tRNA synthetase beta chain
LSREIDLIEDVLRHYGYDRVPATLPQKTQRPAHFPDPRPRVVREALVAAGLDEAITFGFCSLDRILRLQLPPHDRRMAPLVVRNPMTVDQGVMRTSLLPNLLAAAAHNLKYQVSDVRIFEVGTVFLPQPQTAGTVRTDALPDEPVRAAAVLLGRRPAWLSPGDPVDYSDARAAVEAVLRAVLGGRAKEVRFAAASDIPYFHPGVAARVQLGDDLFGEVGEVHPEVRAAFAIESACFALDLDVGRLPLPAAQQMQPIPRYPAVVRDVSFFVDVSVPAGRIADLVATAEEPLVSEVLCREDYRDPERVPVGKKGMLWSITYRSLERTLTDQEVDGVHEAIVATLLAELRATRR